MLEIRDEESCFRLQAKIRKGKGEQLEDLNVWTITAVTTKGMNNTQADDDDAQFVANEAVI